MRNSIRIAAMGAALAFAASTSSAYAATASATATAEILSALTVTNVDPLDFDTIAVNGAGTVTITPAGVISCSATLVCPGTAATAATYTMTGDSNTGVKVTLPASPVTITSGANSMTVDAFSTNWVDGTLLSGGTGGFAVGATLHVGNGQAAGVYSGTFNVSVDYQ